MNNVRRVISSAFFRYSILGVSSLLVKYIFSVILTEYVGLWYFFSYIISLLIVIVYNFILNFIYVFKVNDNKIKRFLKYLFSVLVFNIIDASLVKFFTDGLMVYYLVSIFIVTFIIFITKYFYYKMLVFNKSELF
jgi:putative flippase GtrA